MTLSEYPVKVGCEDCDIKFEFKMGVGIGEAEMSQKDLADIVDHRNITGHKRFDLTVFGSTFTIIAVEDGINLNVFLNQREDWFRSVLDASSGTKSVVNLD